MDDVVLGLCAIWVIWRYRWIRCGCNDVFAGEDLVEALREDEIGESVVAVFAFDGATAGGELIDKFEESVAGWFSGDVFDAFGFDDLDEVALGRRFVNRGAHGLRWSSA